MKNTLAPLFLLTTALALAGCAAMSPQECRTADWREQGTRDALEGQARSHFDDIRQACAEAGVTPRQDLYFDGYARGLRQFCMPANGARWGRQGQSYDSTCPPELEPAFLARYRDGRRAWDAEQGLQRLQNEQRRKQRELDQTKDDGQRRRLRDDLTSLDWRLRNARDDLDRAEQRLRDGSGSPQ